MSFPDLLHFLCYKMLAFTMTCPLVYTDLHVKINLSLIQHWRQNVLNIMNGKLSEVKHFARRRKATLQSTSRTGHRKSPIYVQQVALLTNWDLIS